MKQFITEKAAIILTFLVLTAGGIGWYFYNEAHTTPTTKDVKTFKTSASTSSTKQESSSKEKPVEVLFNTFKQQVNVALQADRYNDIKQIISDAPQRLRDTSEFVAYEADLNKILVAADVLINKDAAKYDATIQDLQLNSDSDIMLRREAEDLIKQIKMLQADPYANEAAPTSSVAKASTPSTEAANPVDLTEIKPLPASLQGYVPNPDSNIVSDVNQRGKLVEILKAKSASHQDDPHTLTQRLIENMNERGASKMEPHVYQYINDIAIRAYAHYVGSDFLDNLWLATYLHDAGYTQYFLGQQDNY